MLRFCQRLAAHHGAALATVRTPGERLPFCDDAFDVVYIANSLHHVNDIPGTVAELRRVLKPGGRFVSVDPLAYNPVINCYRRMATGVRTPDEHPLTRSDVATITGVFRGADVRMFWLLTQVLFLKFFLLDRVHPNSDRYWKRVYKPDVRHAVRGWFPRLAAIDDWLMRRVSPLRWWAWNVVVVAEK
jgi:SAM-dependent methyltransferase